MHGRIVSSDAVRILPPEVIRGLSTYDHPRFGTAALSILPELHFRVCTPRRNQEDSFHQQMGVMIGGPWIAGEAGYRNQLRYGGTSDTEFGMAGNQLAGSNRVVGNREEGKLGTGQGVQVAGRGVQAAERPCHDVPQRA